ncbi:MAG: aminotransferase class III-fold pyridoxal phosphate-dependent enzyme, partial [Calditrichaeota bacterium]
VACAAAIASIDYIIENNLPQRAQHIGEITKERLKHLVTKYKNVAEVRRLGAMIGIEFVADKIKYKPAPEIAKRVQKKCYENGLVILKAGSHGHVMRMLPPLTISEAGLNEGLDIFLFALESI